MARYAFLFPSTTAHVTSSLPLAAELVARNHEVVYYLPHEFEAQARAIGAAFRGYSVRDYYPLPYWEHLDVPPLILLQKHYVAESLNVLPQVIGRVRADRPDVLVYDGMCLWARLVVKILRTPAVTVRTSFAANHRYNLFREFPSEGAEYSLGAPAKHHLRELMGLGRQLSRTYAVAVPGMWSLFTHSGRLNIVMVPRFLHPGVETFDATYVFVGPYFAPDAATLESRADQWIVDKGPHEELIYAAFGTTSLNGRAFLYERCFEAFREQPWQVVLSYGTNLDRSTIGAAPANFRMAARWPQFAILGRTSVFLSHAGLCSVLESLYQGVPLVMLPMMEEHEIVAQIVEANRLGVVLNPKTVTARQLREAVQRVVSDDGYRTRARQMRERLRACGGYKEAADAILGSDHLLG